MSVTKGAEHLKTYQKTEMSQRQYCGQCGGHVMMTNHPTLSLVDVYAATIPTLDFKPKLHVFYSETVLPVKDGLPKLKDFPAELGGSGEAIPESRDVGAVRPSRRANAAEPARSPAAAPATAISLAPT